MNLSGSGHTLSDVALDITVECLDERGIRHEIDTVLRVLELAVVR